MNPCYVLANVGALIITTSILGLFIQIVVEYTPKPSSKY